MKVNKFLLLYFVVLIFYSSLNYTSSGNGFGKEAQYIQQDTVSYISPFQDDNERCFKCHGQSKYVYKNESLGKQIGALMCSEKIVNRQEFYRSNHKSFSCTDCHSELYTLFPHSGELRMEEKYNCIDCHGGDEMYSQFHFEEIEAEYQQSTHYMLEEEGFSCWKCHNPHSYRINIRNTDNLKETIRYDNSICLDCHSDFNHFQLLTEREEINIIRTHDWLPNQAMHFRNVRCIECHTKINNDILVAHLIRPKEDAVRLCNECHSQNSILLTTLYKFQSKEQRRAGFINSIILNQSYVIGANRNTLLNGISIIIFMITLLAIVVHIIFRIR